MAFLIVGPHAIAQATHPREYKSILLSIGYKRLELNIIRFRVNLIVNLVFGEGNGTPLQYSCLENPMDGGAW